MPGSKISYLWDDAHAAREFVSGVSLHSDTNQSKDTLDFLATSDINGHGFIRSCRGSNVIAERSRIFGWTTSVVTGRRH